MTSVGLKDAFFIVPVNMANQKYFRFEWLIKYYQYIVLPNGNSDAMRILPKFLNQFLGVLDKKIISHP